MRGARMSKRNNFTTGADNTLFIHLTLVPKLAMAGEIKSKPTQHQGNRIWNRRLLAPADASDHVEQKVVAALGVDELAAD